MIFKMTSPRSVLDQYLELCSHDLHWLVFHLASNAVLEWNGLTVRGASRIVKFLRQKQHAGQIQSFPGAVTKVPPFEERDTHLATKTTPPENLTSPARDVHPATLTSSPSSVSGASGSSEIYAAGPSDLSFETPPKTLPALPHPPPLTGGRRFLPFPDSDDDEDGDNFVDSAPSANRQSTYSELQYLESVGIVRTANEPKHRGIRTTHHIPRDDPPSAPDSAGTAEVLPTSSGEKRTKLKLSYRTHLRSQEVQFALIIYEHISSRSTVVRRNLFSEEEQQQQPESPPARPHSPEPVPLPDSPELPPEEPARTPIEPPGTPIKRRRIPPVIIGLRTSPRRVLAPDEVASGSGDIIQHTWPRKHSHPSSSSTDGGPSASKQRKLSSAASTIRKPLRF